MCNYTDLPSFGDLIYSLLSLFLTFSIHSIFHFYSQKLTCLWLLLDTALRMACFYTNLAVAYTFQTLSGLFLHVSAYDKHGVSCSIIFFVCVFLFLDCSSKYCVGELSFTESTPVSIGKSGLAR